MAIKEPQFAGDYDDRTTTAVKLVLIEISQILGSFEMWKITVRRASEGSLKTHLGLAIAQ